jgi:NAD(P)-dependent dehydrogenase (short-subunit alcohol dehydrogenase family)
MDLGLKDKTVIVTGAGSNIGRGIAHAFAAEGANVIVADIVEKDGQKVVNEIKSKGGKAKLIKTDVTDYNSVQAMVKAVLDEFGKIDVLVNNVGWDDFKPFMETIPQRWEKYIALNYRQQLNCIHSVLPHMIERKSGRIVNIGSDAGRIGEYRESVYSGCKAAVMTFSKAVAKEVGRFGITINNVCPGATLPSPEETGELSMFSGKDEDHAVMKLFPTEESKEKLAKAYPLRRLGKPQDIANATVFLASDAAEYITGQTLSVSGGYTMI